MGVSYIIVFTTFSAGVTGPFSVTVTGPVGVGLSQVKLTLLSPLVMESSMSTMYPIVTYVDTGADGDLLICPGNIIGESLLKYKNSPSEHSGKSSETCSFITFTTGCLDLFVTRLRREI
jgi:hypothetical protein